MKRLALVFVVVVAACGNKKSEEAKLAPAPEPAAPVAPVPPPAPPADDFATHMKAGDALEKQMKWGEAQAEFELAVKAHPTDASALGEVGWTAWHAHDLARARSASEAMVDAAAQDAKLRGIALFNLGLSIEDTQPNAAVALYAASDALRPNGSVKARFAKVLREQPVRVRETTPDGTALLAKLTVEPAKLPPKRKPSTKADTELFALLEAAGIEWQSATGKEALFVQDVVCTEDAAHAVTCTSPVLRGDPAKALVANLVERKITGTKEGDHTTYKVSQITCTSHNVETDNGQLPADSCDVTK